MKVFSHFQAPDQLTILGISHNRVLTMQHALTLIPIKVVALLPDFLVLPTPKLGEMVLAQINHTLLVRHDALLGASVDDLELYLSVLPKTEQYFYSELTDDQALTLFRVASVEQRKSFDYRFEALPKAKSHPFNVLPKAKSQDNAVSGYWKACAALCVALIMVQLVFDLNRWMKLKKVADETAIVAVDQYKSWFGANSRVTEQNLKSMFESHLRMSQSADTQALQLISRIGPILMQQQIVANRVAYDSNVLNLDLLAKSSEALQSLVTQLNQQGFKAELGNVQTQGSMVLGLVKIQ